MIKIFKVFTSKILPHIIKEKDQYCVFVNRSKMPENLQRSWFLVMQVFILKWSSTASWWLIKEGDSDAHAQLLTSTTPCQAFPILNKAMNCFNV